MDFIKFPSMDFDAAKSQFLEFAQAIQTEGDRHQFFEWMRDFVIPEFARNPTGHVLEEGDQMLNQIAGDIRAQMPLEAVLQSESIVYPTVGEDASLNPGNSVHVDAFLYDEDEEEALVQEGHLSRNHCGDCGSRNIEDTTFITHSCSKERLKHIFTKVLPPLAGKTVVDIGSRIGAVLWGAYYYSQAARVVGIEINGDLCSLQRAVVEKYRLGDRVTVVEGDMCRLGETIKTGDVVILNNVFDWFMAPEVQVQMWKFLRNNISPGSLLVTIPSLETSLEHLNTGIDLSTWVRTFPSTTCHVTTNDDMDSDQVETSEVCLYQILNS